MIHVVRKISDLVLLLEQFIRDNDMDQMTTPFVPLLPD